MDSKQKTIEHLAQVLQPYELHDLEDLCERLFLELGEDANTLHMATILRETRELCRAPVGGQDSFGDLTWRVGPDKQGLPFVRVAMEYDDESLEFTTRVPLTTNTISMDMFAEPEGEGAGIVLDYVGEQLDEEDRTDVFRYITEDAQESVRCQEDGDRLSRHPILISLLRDAIASDNAEAVEDALELGAPVNEVDERGNTPLHLAAQAGRTSMLVPLIHSGAWVDEVNQDGQSPLHLSAKAGNPHSCLILIAHAADIDKRDRFGRRPIDLGQPLEREHEQSL